MTSRSSSEKCVCCPYGWCTALSAFLGGIGFFFAIIAVSHCYFLTATAPSGASLKIGFFSREGVGYYEDDTCYAYTSDEKDAFFDGAWRFGKAMGLIAGIVGFFAFVMSATISCVIVPPLSLKILCGVYVACGIMSILMLVGMASDFCSNIADSCKIAAGGGLAILASVLYLGAGVSTLCLVHKEEDVQSEEAAPPVASGVGSPANEPKETKIEISTTVNEDGSMMTTKVTTNPDGTKTIEKTVEAVGVERPVGKDHYYQGS